MEVTKQELEKKIEQYRKQGEQHRNDSNACFGAAEALEILMRELELVEKAKATQSVPQ